MDENKKPDVFNKNEVKTHRLEGDLEAERLMKEKTDAQIAERQAVLDKLSEMGDLQERDRQKYLKEMMPKVVRPELSQDQAPKGEVIYEEAPIKPKPTSVKTTVDVSDEDYIQNIKNEIELDIDAQSKRNYEALSEPQYDSNSDIIPLPSEGLLYGMKDKNLKVSFLNASDENILTNPNILQSGKFLEILLNRKILNSKIRYDDLTSGDRDAIMIWLRYTGYGDNYPIMVKDPKTNEYFETTIELSKLRVKKLTLKPNVDGTFNFKLPLSGDEISFSFLTIGQITELEKEEELIIERLGEELINSTTAQLVKMIKSVNGDDNPKLVKQYVNNMRLRDVNAFRKFVSENEHGIDMNLTVRTPGGESIATFLPLNTQFFWPEQ